MNDNYRLFKLVRSIKPAAREENATIDSNLVAPHTSSGEAYKLVGMLTKIPEIDISHWTSCAYVFYNCSNLLEIPNLNTSNVTNMNHMFTNCSNLQTIPSLDTSNVTDMSFMFSNCKKLTTVPQLDTNNVTSVGSMFNGCDSLITAPYINISNVSNISYLFASCGKLTTIPELDASNANNIIAIYNFSYNLENIGGLKNLGKAYTQESINYSKYSLYLGNNTKLTHESLINIINNLYNLNLTYNVANGGTLYTQSLSLGVTNMTKLTAEEIAIATNKGWTVS